MSRDPAPPDGDNLLPVRKWRVEARETIADGDGRDEGAFPCFQETGVVGRAGGLCR